MKIEVLEYQNLGGNDNFTVAEKLFFAQKSNIKLRQVISGEGLLQTFRGTGKVIIAPTLPVYEKLSHILNPTPPAK